MQEMTLRDLGNLMRNIRIAKNKELRQKGESEVTQGILAEKIGVSLTTISDWEQGKTQPGVLNFLKFCHALNIRIFPDPDRKPEKCTFFSFKQIMLHVE